MGTQNRSRGARRYTVEPDTDFLVRRAGVEDALQIADVYVAAWRETYGPLLPAGALDSLDAGERAQKWAGIIAGGEEVLVAEDAGGIVAWASGGPGRDDDAPVDRELEGIYSPARVHGSGVGQLLLDAVIADSPLTCGSSTAMPVPRRSTAATVSVGMVRNANTPWRAFPGRPSGW